MQGLSHLEHLTRFARSPLLRAAPVAVLCMTFMAGTAQAKRLALVVGNSEYQNVYALKNAAKDARDVANALKRLDFEVTLLTDTDEQDFWTQLEAFANRADAQDVESTLFYFSGHAFQLDGANYLVPVDATLSSKEAIQTQTWRLDKIVQRLESRNRQTLIFLDACRNNPLPETQRAGAGEGLAKLETGSGTFVAFATQPNNVTADGAGDNSPFTDALLSSIETEGISISDMMIRVRNSVEDSTFGRQTPWDQSSLRAQFYFKPVVERSASLTQADYEMIAGLDPETRNRLLAALGSAGLVVEDAEVDQQIEARVAAADPTFIIEDVSDDPANAPVISPKTAPALKPQDAPVADANPAFTILPDPEDTVVAERAKTNGAAAVVASAQPTVRVQRPRESTVSVISTSIPAAIGADGTARATAGQVAPTTGTDTAVATAPAERATSDATSQRTAALEAETLGTAQTGAALAASTGAVDSTTGVQVADALPADPNNGGREISSSIDDSALVLAALSPTRSLLPVFADRAIVEGEELSREDAARIGIELPEENTLEGRELARAVQIELSRLGCYRSGIDGLWGKGSALALVRYYGNKGIGANDLQPSNALLSLLQTEPKVICEVVSEQKDQRVAKVKAKIQSTRAPAVKKAVAKPSNTSTKRKIQTTRTVTNKDGKTETKTIKRLSVGTFR